MLRRVLGPRYDLDKIWDRHTELEFATRAADETMATMVPEPYVNHIPTMTGGVGHDETLRFYKHHFIPTAPQDTRLVPISRTVGADRVVDEMLFCFTHDNEIDWMLPRREADRAEGRDSAGRHRPLPRRQALQRAHLLGPGLGAGAGRPARPEALADRRHRDRAEGIRRERAVEHADGALEGKRREMSREGRRGRSPGHPGDG